MKKNMIIIIIIIYLSSLSKTFATTNSTIEESEINTNVLIEEQENYYGISSFLNESKKYAEDLEIQSIFKDGLTGKFDNNKLINLLISKFGDNLKQSILTISGIIIIIILNSLLKSISENLGNESVATIAYYVQYILIVTLILSNFSNSIQEIKISIQNLSAFSYVLIPLMTTLIIATGNITTSSLIEPILLSIISFISTFITNVLIPLIMVATALGIISKISDQVQVGRISKFLNKSSIWILTTVLGLFVGIATLEGGLTSNVDNITKKAGKSVISAAVPVVGRIIGDAIDTIIGYTNVIKNATGLVGIFVILGICLKPIINLSTLTIVYSIGSALCEPIADKKIVELIEQMGRTYKTMLAIMFSITIMIVIGVALVIKITS